MTGLGDSQMAAAHNTAASRSRRRRGSVHGEMRALTARLDTSNPSSPTGTGRQQHQQHPDAPSDLIPGLTEMQAAETLADPLFMEWYVAFDEFDVDNDKTVSIKELKVVMSSLGISAADENIHDVCGRFDRNGSGSLDFLEFKGLMEEMTEQTSTGDRLDDLYVDAFKAFDVVRL
jgi:hypothetical protein